MEPKHLVFNWGNYETFTIEFPEVSYTLRKEDVIRILDKLWMKQLASVKKK